MCPDFDLCVDCFVTTDHSATIANLKASADASAAVNNLNKVGGHHAQYQGKQAPLGSSVGLGDTSSAIASSALYPGSGAINHDESHGYRVCDNTRYPLFPNPGKVKVEDKAYRKDENDMAIDGEESLSLTPDDPKAVWTVEEDLRLLDGIETHGLGNWVDIAEAVSGHGSTGKTPKRCMERYFDDYLGVYGQILPPYALVEDTSEEKEAGDGNSSNGGEEETDKNVAATTSTGGGVVKDMDPTRFSKRRHPVSLRTSASGSAQSFNRFNKKLKAVRTESLPEYQAVLAAFTPWVPVREPSVTFGDKVYRDEAAKQEQAFVKQVSALSSEEEKAIRKHWMETRYMKLGGPTVLPARPEDVVKLPGAELAGFMPRRGDFDVEWENDAEAALADMEFLPGDLPEDKKLKLQVLQIYNERLDEREKRKNFILSRKLHDYRKNQEADAKLPRDERDLVRRMRLFERFHSPEEHKQFLDDILKAKRLRKEIAKLQMYRRIGITSLVEAEKYELDKSRHNFHKMAVLQKDAAASKQKADKSNPAGTADGSSAVPNMAGKKEDRNGGEVKSPLWKEYKERRRSSDTVRSQDSPAAVSDATRQVECAKDGQTDMTMQDDEANKKGEPESDNGNANGDGNDDGESQSEQAKDSSGGGTVAIEKMEGFSLLSDEEVSLCRKINFTPKEYMEVKKVLIFESLKNGMLDKEGSKPTFVKVDVEKRGEVVDFMVHAGWLPREAASIARAISE